MGGDPAPVDEDAAADGGERPEPVDLTSGGVDPSVAHLLERVAVVEARVHAEVERRREEETTDPDDGFRGLYVSDLRVDDLLDRGPYEPVDDDPDLLEWRAEIDAAADEVEAAGTTLRLRRLATTFELTDLDIELLLIALAPDLDPRFEQLYGYLNDDVSKRRATVGLALLLCGVSLASGGGRGRLAMGGPLRRSGLLSADGVDRPSLSRDLTVPDRVLAHLLGDDSTDELLAPMLLTAPPVTDTAADELAHALRAGNPTAYLRAQRGAGAVSAAVAAFEQLGMPALCLDLTRLDGEIEVEVIAGIASREARLLGAGLIAGPIEALSDRSAADVRAFADVDGGVILHGTASWDPAWSRDVPVLVEVPRAAPAVQAEVWREELDGQLDADVDPAEVTALFRLTPEQVQRAARSARQQASLRAAPVGTVDLQRGARSQNAAGLQRLARRVEPRATWDELILPAPIEGQLRELAARWRHRDQVLEGWGLGRAAARGRGVSALFSGGSGTGKTLGTEVVAADLGLDLYVIDLSTVVDKYIGETSKNLERIFDEADRVNGVLLFDEADALFGKRSSVQDSKDRHANVEVAFLLQRMEVFDGVAILTTNLAANLDDAFIRRLDAIVDFPTPDEEQRRRLWQAKLTDELPQADDVDVQVLADRFKLSGSEIRNVVVSAAYRAADEHRAVSMEDLVRAIVREHRKLGKHLPSSDLGEFVHLVEGRA